MDTKDLKFSKENHDDIVMHHLLEVNARVLAVEMLLVDVYAHISGKSIEEIEDQMTRQVELNLNQLQVRLVNEFGV